MSALGALQKCLAAEHATLYGYGLIGGVISSVGPGTSEQVLADAAYVEHRRRRDDLTAMITSLDATPVVAEPVYASPRSIATLEDCRVVGQLLENRCADVYALAVSQTVDATRELVARALTACALRAFAWGAKPQAFPGIAEF